MTEKMSHLRGKKRFPNGEVKVDRNGDGNVNRRGEVNPKKRFGRAEDAVGDAQSRGKPFKAHPKQSLEQLDTEVYLLGGTDEDLKLVRGADSGSEIDGGMPSKKKGGDMPTDKEILGMVRQLGLEQVNAKDLTFFDSDEGGLESEDKNNSSTPSVSSQPETGPPSTSLGFEKSSPRVGANHLVFPIISDWHATKLPDIPEQSQDLLAPTPMWISQIHDHARALLEKENKDFATRQKRSSSSQFYSTLMTTGTLSDKISALTLSVQESPVHNMKALESLINLARKRSRDQAVNVLAALKDLLGPGNILPSDRHLRPFAGQPALSTLFRNTHGASWTIEAPLPRPLGEIHLIYWAFEDWLKSAYFQVLQLLESWCSDEVVFSRIKAVEYASQMLKDKPEQEANLLRLLVNKLGDSDKNVASRASFSILQLQTSHPLMKLTVINSVESDLLFRPGQSLHAQYFAAITLNQTVLDSRSEDVAKKLLSIYFHLFVKLLQKPETAKDTPKTPAPVKVNKKGQIQGGGSLPGKKALKKQKLHEKSDAVEQDLREKLLSALLTGVNRAVPFLSANDESLEGHLDTLFRVAHSSNFNTSVQALILIQQICSGRVESQDRFYRVLYESLLDSRLLTSSKQALYLNLLYKALRADFNEDRVKGFAKRLLQIAAIHQAPFSCGVIYLLRELEKTCPNLPSMVDESRENLFDEEEVFRDVDEDPSSQPDLERQAVKGHHASQTTGTAHSKYDPRKRDPIFASAKNAALWELAPLLHHYHPSVSLFSQRMVTHEAMPPVPDLQQNTLIHFLDRFVFKNPKPSHVDKVKGISIMQPLAAGSEGNILLPAYSVRSRIERPVNIEGSLQQNTANISANDVFFHRYFDQMGNLKGKGKQRKDEKGKGKKGKKAADSDDDGEDEEEIWRALVDSQPEIEDGDEEGGIDDDEFGEGFEDDSEDDLASDDEVGPADGDRGSLVSELDESDAELGDSDEVGDIDAVTNHVTNGLDVLGEEDGARKRRKRKLRSLPTFADASNFAEMLDEEDE